MFRTLHWISTSLLLALAILSTRGPVPRTRTNEASASTAKVSNLAEPRATTTEPVEWYEPQEDDFKPVYHGDAQNLAKQSWSDYWGWVKSFYRGNFLDSGWTKRCQDLVGNIKRAEQQTALRKKLNALGKYIAAEWAKTNGARKIDSAKLLSWGSRLQEAMKKDSGEGEVIQREIELIAREAGAGI